MEEDELKQKLEKTLENLKDSLKPLRVGRASASMIEDIEVEAYNAKLTIKELASISVPQSDQIVIQPWDPGTIENIQKAILQSEADLNPNVESNTLRINLPPVTEEKRKEIVKDVHKQGEEAKVAIRNIREDAVKNIEEKEKNKEISEDEKFAQKDKVQNMINDYNNKVEETIKAKEEDIMSN